MLERLKNEFNLIYRAWLGPDLYVILIDPVDIEVSLRFFFKENFILCVYHHSFKEVGLD